jgi:hypothetical protein
MYMCIDICHTKLLLQASLNNHPCNKSGKSSISRCCLLSATQIGKQGAGVQESQPERCVKIIAGRDAGPAARPSSR